MPTPQLTNVTVTTSPTLVITSRIGGSNVKLGNTSGKVIYLGDENVTSSTGLKLATGTIETFNFRSLSVVYAVVATGTAQLDIVEY